MQGGPATPHLDYIPVGRQTRRTAPALPNVMPTLLARHSAVSGLCNVLLHLEAGGGGGYKLNTAVSLIQTQLI